MEDLKGLIQNRFKHPPKPSSERGELLAYFRDGVNAGRDGVQYKKLHIGFIAKKLEGLELRDLYYMKSTIEQERRRGANFGKMFFGMLNYETKISHHEMRNSKIGEW